MDYSVRCLVERNRQRRRSPNYFLSAITFLLTGFHIATCFTFTHRYVVLATFFVEPIFLHAVVTVLAIGFLLAKTGAAMAGATVVVVLVVVVAVGTGSGSGSGAGSGSLGALAAGG